MMVGRLSKEKRQDVIIDAVPYTKYAKRFNIDESVRQCERMFQEAIEENNGI
jgi:hypothetical protein